MQGLIAVKPNQPLSQDAVNATVTALKDSPGVTDVHVDLQPSADGVQVEFVLRPAMYIGMYQFPGALNEFTYTRLLQVANYNPQTPYSANDIGQAEDALTTFFRQHGYFLAEVETKLEQDKQNGLINVAFQSHLGKRAKIRQESICRAPLRKRPHTCRRSCALCWRASAATRSRRA